MYEEVKKIVYVLAWNVCMYYVSLNIHVLWWNTLWNVNVCVYVCMYVCIRMVAVAAECMCPCGEKKWWTRSSWSTCRFATSCFFPSPETLGWPAWSTAPLQTPPHRRHQVRLTLIYHQSVSAHNLFAVVKVVRRRPRDQTLSAAAYASHTPRYCVSHNWNSSCSSLCSTSSRSSTAT